MKILFVDDLTFSMKYYIQGLRDNGIHVEVRSDVDRALEVFRSEGPWDGAVIDLMFDQPQPPARYMADDSDGQKTGILLANDLRAIQSDLRIIVLTNRAESPEAQQLRERPHVRVVRKLDIGPIDFVDTVRSFFGAPS
jgi:CheY-like chemotaxis protein